LRYDENVYFPILDMLAEYIQAALKYAVFESVDGDFFCYVPQLKGAWAKAPTQAECLIELASVLEEWILFGLKMGQSIPTIDGFNFDFAEQGDGGEAA
jgi:predicted RNase H-like HicB family nuclease